MTFINIAEKNHDTSKDKSVLANVCMHLLSSIPDKMTGCMHVKIFKLVLNFFFEVFLWIIIMYPGFMLEKTLRDHQIICICLHLFCKKNLQVSNFWHGIETKITSNKGYSLGARTAPKIKKETTVSTLYQ